MRSVFAFLLSLFLLSGSAHAGERWKRFCERYLIAENPYDLWETLQPLRSMMTREEYVSKILKRYNELGMRMAWRKGSQSNKQELTLLGGELRDNRDVPGVELALIRYEGYEHGNH
jgi:hypothetical protein